MNNTTQIQIWEIARNILNENNLLGVYSIITLIMFQYQANKSLRVTI